MTDIKKLIKKIDKLEPISRISQKVLSIIEDPESSASELSEIISYDQAVTANLLKMCNSSYFGLSRQIDSVHHAIVFLGMDQVVKIVLMSCAAKNLKQKQSGYDLQENELWRHSVASALITRDLIEKKGQKQNYLIFTAALLKDIGKLVLSQHVGDSFEEINSLVTKHGLSFAEAEQKVIGIDHAELGAMIADKWKLSSEIVDIIRNHHQPKKSLKNKFETCVVHLADIICMMLGIGLGADGLAYRLDNSMLEYLEFTEIDIQIIMAGFGEKLEKVEELVGIS